MAIIWDAVKPEADRIEVWNSQINAGPWLPEVNVVGVKCQLCGDRIWREGFVRPGDNLSPALYRHDVCHNFLLQEKKNANQNH